jgi:hypothetical protein
MSMHEPHSTKSPGAIGRYPRAQILSGLIVWGVIAVVAVGIMINWMAALATVAVWVVLGRVVLVRHRNGSQ